MSSDIKKPGIPTDETETETATESAETSETTEIIAEAATQEVVADLELKGLDGNEVLVFLSACRGYIRHLSQEISIPAYIEDKIRKEIEEKHEGEKLSEAMLKTKIKSIYFLKYREEIVLEVVKSFLTHLSGILDVIERERESQGQEPYDVYQKTVLGIQLIKHLFHFSGYLRKDKKTSYSEGHIIPVLHTLVDEMGITDDISILAALHHDDKEDLKREGRPAPELIYIPMNEEEELHGINEYRERLQKEVGRLVDGLTNIEAESKDEKKAKTLKNLLEHVLESVYGLFIKFADRLNNLSTLEHLSEESRERMVRETVNVYLPLAHKFGVKTVRDKMMEYCVKYLNSKLYEDYLEDKKAKEKTLRNYHNEFGDIFQYNSEAPQMPRTKFEVTSLAELVFKYLSKPEHSVGEDFFETLKSLELKDLEEMHGKLLMEVESASGFKRIMGEGIRLKLLFDTLGLSNVEIEVYLLMDKIGPLMKYSDLKKAVSGLEMHDLNLIIRRFMEFGLVVIGNDVNNSGEKTDDDSVISIVDNEVFFDDNEKCIAPNQRKGKKIDSWLLKEVQYLDGKRHQGLVLQRQIKKRHRVEIEMMTRDVMKEKILEAKQGILKGSETGKISTDLRGAIQRVIGNLNSWGDIYILAAEELFQPPIKVYTPDEREIELSSTATYLDYAKNVHGALLFGLQSVIVNGRECTPDRLFEMVQENEQIQLNSCIPPTIKMNSIPDDIKEKIKFSPSWYYLAGMEDTRRRLRSSAKKVYVTEVEVGDMFDRYRGRLGRLFGQSNINYVVNEFVKEEKQRMTDNEVRKATKARRLPNDISETDVQQIVMEKIVYGELDFIGKLSEIDFDWYEFEIELDNKKGQLEQLSKRLKYINLEGLYFEYDATRPHKEEKKRGIIALRLPKDPRGRKFYFVNLLKASYAYSDMRVREIKKTHSHQLELDDWMKRKEASEKVQEGLKGDVVDGDALVELLPEDETPIESD